MTQQTISHYVYVMFDLPFDAVHIHSMGVGLNRALKLNTTCDLYSAQLIITWSIGYSLHGPKILLFGENNDYADIMTTLT